MSRRLLFVFVEGDACAFNVRQLLICPGDERVNRPAQRFAQGGDPAVSYTHLTLPTKRIV